MLDVELISRVYSALPSMYLVPAPIPTHNLDGLVDGSAPRQTTVGEELR